MLLFVLEAELFRWGVTVLPLLVPDNLFDDVLLFTSEDLCCELLDPDRTSEADRFLAE